MGYDKQNNKPKFSEEDLKLIDDGMNELFNQCLKHLKNGDYTDKEREKFKRIFYLGWQKIQINVLNETSKTHTQINALADKAENEIMDAVINYGFSSSPSVAMIAEAEELIYRILQINESDYE